MKPYPQTIKEDVGNHTDVLLQITRLRKEDVQEITNLNNIFISGRKVGRVPTSSANVIDGDRVGDVNYDLNYLYLLSTDGVTPAWRRIALVAW